MTPSDKVDTVTGILTVSFGVISGSFSSADFHEWGTTFMSLSPFVLVLFLIWRIRQLDLQHKQCGDNLSKTQDKLDLMYHAITDIQVRRNMPTAGEFRDGNFDTQALINREI